MPYGNLSITLLAFKLSAKNFINEKFLICVSISLFNVKPSWLHKFQN